MGDFMSNNFVKRQGRLSDNLDLQTSNWVIKTKILASDSTNIILYNLKKGLIPSIYFQFTSSRCLDYYIRAENRSNSEKFFSLTELFGLPDKKLQDIARKNTNINQDFLSFYGCDAMSRGNLYVYTNKIKNYLINNVRYAIRNNVPKEQILKFYTYQDIPEIIRDKNSVPDNDFYFAVGDGNCLYGQVHTLNERKREFQILYVLYDEYNWDDNITYFLKEDTGKGAYRLVVETAAFKKLEKAGIAKPFLQFFIDTYTVSY